MLHLSILKWFIIKVKNGHLKLQIPKVKKYTYYAYIDCYSDGYKYKVTICSVYSWPTNFY